METPKTTIIYPIELFLRLSGVWPKSSHKILRRVFCFSVYGTSLTFQFWYVISYLKSADLPHLLDAFSVILSNSIVFLKLIILWCNYRMFCTILAILSDDWNNSALNSQYKELMMDKVNLSSRVSKSILSIFPLSVVFYLITTVFLPDDADEELPSKNRKMLTQMRLPFDVMTTPKYEIFLTVQFLVQNMTAYIAGMFMALFAALVLHAGGQINIMCQRLAEFSTNDEKHTRQELTRLVINHQQIIHLCEKIKCLFTYISCVQLFANTLVLCFLGFVIVTSVGNEKQSTSIVKCLPYYVVILFAAFVLCYTGEYLTSKCEDINDAAYNAFWYKLHPRQSRIFLLLLMQSQRPVTLTAGKIVNLSLETFANMLKASASYISVLLAMY